MFGWKVTKFIKNTNYDFVRKQILSVCGEDNVDDALNLISNWVDNWKDNGKCF